MKANNLIMGIIGIVVCAIMVSGALMPAVSSAISDNQTIYNNNITNDPTLYVDRDMTTSYVIEYVPGNNYITIDGKDLSISTYGGNVIWSSAGYLLASTDSSLTNYLYGYLVNSTGAINGVETTTKIVVNVVNDDITITFEGTGTTYNLNDCDWIAYPSEKGTHKLTSSSRTSPIYINSIDDVLGTFYVNTQTYGLVSFIGENGTRVNGDAVNMVINAVKDDTYRDLYVLNDGASIYLDPAIITNSNGTNVVPYFYLVPYEVTTETENGHIINVLFNVIPIISIMGLVMAGIYVFISRK